MAIFSVVIFINSVNAQKKICYSCDKTIDNDYLLVENKYYHPSHFVCTFCKKQLFDEFVSEDDGFYHDDCYSMAKGLICDYCNKLIKNEYLILNNNKYHKTCYSEVLPKCSLCDKPLVSNYMVDFYGNKYHPQHNNELSRCVACNRLISEKLTNGGNTYSDGRHICNICYSDAIHDDGRISGLFEKVRTKLAEIGLQLPFSNIKIKGVSVVELRKVSGGYFSKGVKGFCETISESINGSKTKQIHHIYVLNGLPAASIEAIIAHELMHVWIYRNTKRNHSKAITEGSCNYISFLYLSAQKQSLFIKQLIKEIESDPSPDYGDGFRTIKSRFINKNISEMINFLKGL